MLIQLSKGGDIIKSPMYNSGINKWLITFSANSINLNHIKTFRANFKAKIKLSLYLFLISPDVIDHAFCL